MSIVVAVADEIAIDMRCRMHDTFVHVYVHALPDAGYRMTYVDRLPASIKRVCDFLHLWFSLFDVGY